uniref:EF-hand domain-containing protein n=1 Tax=Setaria digitata TaxID=48799 RepID=A0A915Q0X4_9BILA
MWVNGANRAQWRVCQIVDSGLPDFLLKHLILTMSRPWMLSFIVSNTLLWTATYGTGIFDLLFPQDIFRKADRNGDKFIDRSEIIAAVRQVRRHVARATLRWLELIVHQVTQDVQDHDTDGDGILNEMELFESAYMEHGLSIEDIASCFRESDVSKDGYLISSELVETLHCIRLLALKEGKQLLEIYDTDGDHRLDIREAQMLAGLRYDIEPGYATVVFEDINELELIDFLTKLREEAAIAALNKLSGLDQNGDEAVSFGELLQGYEKQLKKPVLKKIFGKVDVNKNAHIDPIEFVSLQNLVADEIRLQTLQNDFQQESFPTTVATTSLPTLIIFGPLKKQYHPRSTNQRKRRSDSEADKKIIVTDDSQPSIREMATASASNVHFNSLVTTVPKFMKSSDENQKFLSDGAQLLAEMSTYDKRTEKKENITETFDVKGIQEKSVSDETIRPFSQPVVQEDRKFNADVSGSGTVRRIIGNEYVRDQNEALNNSPNTVYIKKFKKFFDFLQNAIKKVTKAVKENKEKQSENLKSPVGNINITRRASQTTDNISSIGISEVNKAVNVSEILAMTTSKNLKMEEGADYEIYERIRDENGMIVHTPVDSSEYETVTARNFKTILNEKESNKMSKLVNYDAKGHERSLEKRNFHDAIESEEDEDDWILAVETNIGEPTDSSEHQTGSATSKLHKKSKKRKLSSEPNQESTRRKKLHHSPPDKVDSSENYTEVTSDKRLLRPEDKLRVVKQYTEHDDDEGNEMIPEAEGDEESGESSEEAGKDGSFDKSSEQESSSNYAMSTSQPFSSRKMSKEAKLEVNLTNKDDKIISSSSDSSELVEFSNETKGKTLFKKNLTDDKSVSELSVTQRGVDIKEGQVLKPSLVFSTEENGTIMDEEVHSRTLKAGNSSSEETQLKVTRNKYQIRPSSNEEDDFFDELQNVVLNLTIPEIDQASKAVISKTIKFENEKKDFQKNVEHLSELQKNDVISQPPKTSPAPAPSPSPEISLILVSKTEAGDNLSTTMDQAKKLQVRTSFLTDDTSEQTTERIYAESGIAIESKLHNGTQNLVSPDAVLNASISSESKNDVTEGSRETAQMSLDLIHNLVRSTENEVTDQRDKIEAELIQKENMECSSHSHSSESQKCPTKDNITVEVTVPNVGNGDECRLKQICRENQRLTSSSRPAETSGSIGSSMEVLSQKIEIGSPSSSKTNQLQMEEWRTEATEDLLLQAVQEYQAYLKNQKRMKN